MPGHWSWDDMKEHVTDGQNACESQTYRRGCWLIEECTVRGEDGQILGKITTSTIISNADVPREWDYVKASIAEVNHFERAEIDQFLYKRPE
jgi:hypothetical protein